MQGVKRTIDGELTVYEFDDGHASVAENDVWVSALFKSKAAAITWRGHMTEAETAFAALNPPTGKGENFLGPR